MLKFTATIKAEPGLNCYALIAVAKALPKRATLAEHAQREAQVAYAAHRVAAELHTLTCGRALAVTCVPFDGWVGVELGEGAGDGEARALIEEALRIMYIEVVK